MVLDAFDHGSSVTIDPANRRITGYTTRNSGGVPENFKNYFVMEFDTPFTYTATVTDSVLSTACKSATLRTIPWPSWAFPRPRVRW